MLIQLLSYGLAFICVLLSSVLAAPVMALSVSVCRRLSSRAGKVVSVVIAALANAAGVLLAFMTAIWFIVLIGGDPRWLMFIIPGLGILNNDWRRLKLARSGRSKVHAMMQAADQGEAYDRGQDVWTERSHLIGVLVGWSFGAYLTLLHSQFM